MFGACAIVIMFSYHYYTLYVLHLLNKSSTNDKPIVYTNAVIHTVLVLMIFWSLLTTWMTDPGYVKSFFSTLELPRENQANEEEQK